MPERPGMPPAFERLMGTVIAGRYVVEKCVGVGGMAAVFRGRHATLDRAVAIKVLRPEYLDHGEVVARFDREARAASHFDHPNCIQVFDCGSTPDGYKFMVMPFLEGRELGKVLGRRLPASQVTRLGVQVLRGLEYAHRRGVVHRDLKPDNIYVVRDHEAREVLKVVDFGIAKIVDEKQKVDDIHTKVGAIVGTPAYMSPEQAMGADIDARADLYSLGIIMYQMLAGKLPFVAADARGLLYQHVAETPAPLPDDIPEDLSAIVLRLLAKNPEERFATASATIAALTYVGKGLANDPTPWVRLLAEPVRENGSNPSNSMSGGTMLSPEPGRERPVAPPRPKSVPDPATTSSVSTRPPSERSGASALSSGEKRAIAAQPNDDGRLNQMSAALENFLSHGDDSVPEALRSGIFEPPAGGWNMSGLDTGIGIQTAPVPPPSATRTPPPGNDAPVSAKPEPEPAPKPEPEDGFVGRSLTPHFSDTGFDLDKSIAEQSIAAMASAASEAAPEPTKPEGTEELDIAEVVIEEAAAKPTAPPIAPKQARAAPRVPPPPVTKRKD